MPKEEHGGAAVSTALARVRHGHSIPTLSSWLTSEIEASGFMA